MEFSGAATPLGTATPPCRAGIRAGVNNATFPTQPATRRGKWLPAILAYLRTSCPYLRPALRLQHELAALFNGYLSRRQAQHWLTGAPMSPLTSHQVPVLCGSDRE